MASLGKEGIGHSVAAERETVEKQEQKLVPGTLKEK